MPDPDPAAAAVRPGAATEHTAEAAAFFHHPDGSKVAYVVRPGKQSRIPGVIFCCGFRSHMGGTKARWLENFCARHGLAYCRFDYRGHGASDGAFEEGCIGDWLADALLVLDRATAGPQIVVGSSMGAWIAVLMARARPARVAGLVGVAAAADFTERLLLPGLSVGQRSALKGHGRLVLPSDYDPAGLPVTRHLVEEARRHLVLGAPIPWSGPARLLHGLADPDVPWDLSLELAGRLAGADISLTLVKDGDHRLSRPEDLDRIGAALLELTRCVKGDARRDGAAGEI